MTDADSPVQPRKKKTLLIVLAVAAVAVVGLAAALIVAGNGGHKVRYEIESSSGKTNGIIWSLDNYQLGRKVPATAEGTIATPWSTTVRFTTNNQIATLTTETDDGTATCRIFQDGRKVAEATTERVATCQVRIAW